MNVNRIRISHFIVPSRNKITKSRRQVINIKSKKKRGKFVFLTIKFKLFTYGLMYFLFIEIIVAKFDDKFLILYRIIEEPYLRFYIWKLLFYLQETSKDFKICSWEMNNKTNVNNLSTSNRMNHIVCRSLDKKYEVFIFHWNFVLLLCRESPLICHSLFRSISGEKQEADNNVKISCYEGNLTLKTYKTTDVSIRN